MEFKCGSWKVMKNKITREVLHLQTKEKGKKFPLGLKFECQLLIYLADFLSHDLNEQKYCFHIRSIAVAVYYTTMRQDSTRIER